MAEQLVIEPPLVVRALRLLRISTFTPLALLVVAVAVTMEGPGGRVIWSFGAIVLGIMMTLVARPTISTPPHIWSMTAAFGGMFVAFFFMGTLLESPSDRRLGLPTPMFVTVSVLLSLGVLMVSWLPARRAARLVLDDLSSDVVNSSLTISFKSRVKSTDILQVTAESLQIMRKDKVNKAERSCRLSAVSAVAVRTETDDSDYPVPGAEKRLIPVTRGEVVVVDLPDGQLVFPSKDPQRLKRFIEERARRVVDAEDGRWL
jgi:hypothetical protein